MKQPKRCEYCINHSPYLPFSVGKTAQILPRIEYAAWRSSHTAHACAMKIGECASRVELIEVIEAMRQIEQHAPN